MVSKENIFLSTVKISTLVNRVRVKASILDQEKKGRLLSLVVFNPKIRASDFLSYFLRLRRYESILKNSPGDIGSIVFRDIQIGVYVYSAAVRDPYSFISKKRLLSNFRKRFVRAFSIVREYNKIRSRVISGFIDHPVYLNGILLEMLTGEGKEVYLQNYPFNFRCLSSKAKISHSKISNVPAREYSNSTDVEEGRKILAKIVNGEERLPYMETFTDRTTEFLRESKFDYVIYAHSFTDAQNPFGFDSVFCNVWEWIRFTINECRKYGTVCVKAHPNFYLKGWAAQTIMFDRFLFESLMKEYDNDAGVFFVDYPVSNKTFLDSFDNNPTVISHHGTALLEAGFLGFKCISSAWTCWSEWNLFNEWKNKSEYINLIKTRTVDLLKVDEERLAKFAERLYCSENSFFNKKNLFSAIVADCIEGVTVEDVRKNPLEQKASVEQENNIVDRLVSSFETQY